MLVSYTHKWILLLVLFLHFALMPTKSQDNYANPLDVLLIQLEDALEKGNPRAIRELAGVMDVLEKDKKEKVIQLLQKHTLFPQEQIEWNQDVNREIMMNFLNTYETEIHYSPILRVFMTNPIEDFETEHLVIRKRNLSDKEKSSLLKRYIEVLNATSESQLKVFTKYQLKEIALLQSYESYDFMLGCLEGRNIKSEIFKSDYFISTVCDALTYFDDPYVLDVILEQMEKGRVEEEDAERMLARFTNVKFKEDNTRKLARNYRSLMDSLGTLSGIRNYGFEEKASIRLSYFDEPVDYYAYLLANHFENPWLRENALREMLATGNPRGLFYLSAVLFAYYNSSALDRKILEDKFDQYLTIAIQSPDKNEIYRGGNDKRKDRTYYMNQAIYWSKNYINYEYDADRRIFINIKLEEENEASATRLFKKLTSDNDMVALESFKDLSRYPPSIINKLYAKFQSVLRRANPRLPDFRYGFLENITLLQEFCEMEGIPIELSEEIHPLLDELKSDIPIKERYAIEDRIIKELELEDLTGLEIEGLVHSKNINFNFSISRILDIYYSKNLRKIMRSDLELRLFLKKSVLFSSIGVGGISNKYFSKLEKAKQQMESKLIKLSRKEYDEDIRDAISYILPEDEEESTQKIPVASFMEEPLEFGNREFHLVEEPSSKDIKDIFREINSDTDAERKLKFIEYLTLHSSDAYTPYLLQSLKNTDILSEGDNYKRTVADAAVLLLENIYDFSFSNSDEQPLRESAGKWYAFSKQHKDTRKWKGILFNMSVDATLNNEALTIGDLNGILNHDYCNGLILKKCMAALQRIRRPDNVRKLNLDHLLDADYIPFFAKLEIKDKYLDDVLEMFNTDKPDVLYQYLLNAMSGKSLMEKGKVYNRVADQGWLIPFVSNTEEKKTEIMSSLQSYLDDSEFISEFEEKRILQRLFTMKYGELSIAEKISRAKDFISDETQVYEIQQNLLSQVEYNDLSLILDATDDLIQLNDESAFHFLEKRLGLPSYLFDNERIRKEFRKDVNSMTEMEIYNKYLNLAGLNVFLPNKELDYRQVREVLEFDIVSPFSSTVSRNRIHYAKGVIQLLHGIYPDSGIELTNSDDIREHAHDWIDYLKQKGLIEDDDMNYSFNHND